MKTKYEKDRDQQIATAVVLALALLLYFLKDNPGVMDAIVLFVFGAK